MWFVWENVSLEIQSEHAHEADPRARRIKEMVNRISIADPDPCKIHIFWFLGSAFSKILYVQDSSDPFYVFG